MSDEVNAFSAINAINTSHEINPYFIPEYNPFLTNYALSLHSDTIMYSNEMNMLHHLPKEQQYQYYVKEIKKRKRFSKWPKKLNSDVIKLISSVYNINYGKAIAYSKILTEEQINILKLTCERGGKNNGK